MNTVVINIYVNLGKKHPVDWLNIVLGVDNRLPEEGRPWVTPTKWLVALMEWGERRRKACICFFRGASVFLFALHIHLLFSRPDLSAFHWRHFDFLIWTYTVSSRSFTFDGILAISSSLSLLDSSICNSAGSHCKPTS